MASQSKPVNRSIAPFADRTVPGSDRAKTEESEGEDIGCPSGPEVGLEVVSTTSDVLQSQLVVHGVVDSLLATQILLGRLQRHVPKQKLNLFKLPACDMA